ncbi:MAG TPA: hypothetical protein VH278_09800 [Burkholderiaceae bacterium]|nr:hypothetical protein [Burkholderiaceae bacterium]
MHRTFSDLISPHRHVASFYPHLVDRGINDLGQIAAQANLVAGGVVTGTLHAVLLVPTQDRGDEAVPAAADAPGLAIPEDGSSADATARVRAPIRPLIGRRL